jgi:hypothetical protein
MEKHGPEDKTIHAIEGLGVQGVVKVEASVWDRAGDSREINDGGDAERGDGTAHPERRSPRVNEICSGQDSVAKA